MSVTTGVVRPDGTSAISIPGVYDMAALGESAQVPEHVEKKLEELYQKAGIVPHTTEAKFKLEVFFRGGPRRNVPVRGLLAAWVSGGFLNGGGDTNMYFCPVRQNGVLCLNPVDIQFAFPVQTPKERELGAPIRRRAVVCTACRQITNTLDLGGQLIVETTTQHWASLIQKFFYLLQCDADLVVYVEKESIRTASEQETEKDRRGERYARVEAERLRIVYRLQDIIADTRSGATLETRIKAFLEA